MVASDDTFLKISGFLEKYLTVDIAVSMTNFEVFPLILKFFINNTRRTQPYYSYFVKFVTFGKITDYRILLAQLSTAVW